MTLVVEFDISSDPSFKQSLLDLDHQIATHVLTKLQAAHRQLPWSEFCDLYNWSPLKIEPIDSFPGGMDFFEFKIPVARSLVRIGATMHKESSVLCIVCHLVI